MESDPQSRLCRFVDGRHDLAWLLGDYTKVLYSMDFRYPHVFYDAVRYLNTCVWRPPTTLEAFKPPIEL